MSELPDDSAADPAPPRARPLRARPGARYACAGDGLCCTDVHALGPVSETEAATLELISPDVLTEHPASGSRVLQTAADGACVFAAEDGCALHAALGAEGKPASCRQFPLGVTATPAGGRITSEHLCPCRTMGERPAITPEDAEPSLLDADGELHVDRRVGPLVPIAAGRRVPFDEWEPMEGELMGRLLRGDDPASVLDAATFPELAAGSWRELAAELSESEALGRGEREWITRYERALTWAGDAMAAMLESRTVEAPAERPWAHAFDRAEARAPDAGDPGMVLADWVADQIWTMRWALTGSLHKARAELATRVALARALAEALRREGVRPDRAAAEAVSVVELTGNSEDWAGVVRRIRN